MAFDPFKSGVAVEEKPFDPFASGAAEEERKYSTASNVTNLAARGALDQGFYTGLEGVTRTAKAMVRGTAESVPGDRAGMSIRLERARARRRELAGQTLYTPAMNGETDYTPREAYEENAGVVAELDKEIADLERQLAARKAPGEGALDWYAGAVRETRQDIREGLPVDEGFEKSLGGQIIAGLGQAAGTLPLYAVPGAGPGVTVGQLYQQGYDDALGKGATEAEAAQAGLLNVPAAAIDVASDRLVVGRILKPLKGKLTVGQLVKSVAVTSGAGAGSEGAQQVWQNVVAGSLAKYDPDRPLDDEVINSMIVGAAVSGAATAVGSVANQGRGRSEEQGARSEERQVEDLKSEDLRSEKAAAFDPFATGQAVEETNQKPEAGGLGSEVEGQPPAPLDDNFDEVTPETVLAERQASNPLTELDAPSKRLADSVPPGSETSGQLAKPQGEAITERSGEQSPAEISGEVKLAQWKKAAAAKKGARLRIGSRPDGISDVLDAIQEEGGIAPPGENAGGEYDGFRETFRSGLPRILVRKNASKVDDLVGQMEHYGFPGIKTPDQLYEAVLKAVKDRKRAVETAQAEMDQAKFEAAVFENKGRSRRDGSKQIPSDSLNVGDRFMVKGEPFEVTHVNPDTGDVTIQDGPRYGTQVLPGATEVFVDGKTLRKARPAAANSGTDNPFARRAEEPGQGGLFDGGETGGDTTFNLAGETGTDFAGAMDEQARVQAAQAAMKKAQGVFDFAQRSPEQAAAVRADLAAKQAQWRANADKIAPGLMEKFSLEFGDPRRIVELGRAEFRDLTGYEEAAYLAKEKMFFLFDQALLVRSDLGTTINLLHEMGHAFHDTLPEERQAEVLELWRKEMVERKGPLFDRKGNLKRGVALGVESSVKEWFAERLAWANHEWARRRMGAAAGSSGLFGKIAQQFRQLLGRLRNYLEQLHGQTIDRDFRTFLDQGPRFAEETVEGAPDVIAFSDGPQVSALVSRNMNGSANGWRLTWFDEDFQPTGHTEHRTQADAIKTARLMGAKENPDLVFARRRLEPVEDFARNARAWIVRNFTSAGGLPKGVLELKLAKEGRLASIAKQMEFALRDADRAMHAVYGGYRAMTAAQAQQVNAVLGGQAPVGTLDARLQGPLGEMRNHIDTLSRRLVAEGVVDGALAARVGAQVGFYLNRSYRKFDDPKWAKHVPEAVLNRARSFIAAELQAQVGIGPVDPRLVEGYVQYLIGKNVGGVEDFHRAPREGAMDLRVLTKRQEIPEEIRDLLGEYKDPRVNYLKSVAKTAQILESHRFLLDVRKVGYGQWLFDRQVVDATGAYTVPVAPEGSAAMGALAGLYTTPEIAKAFQSTFTATDDVWRWWRRVNGWAKAAKTVLSPMTQARNFAGNLGFLVANGHWRAEAAADVWSALRAEFGWGDTPRARDYVAKLARLGVIGESVTAGELKEAINDAGVKLKGFETWTDGRLMRAAKAPFSIAARIYRLNDEVYKVYAFENERRAWAKADPRLTAAQLDAIAAERVRNTLPTYSLIPKGVQAVRRYALTGSFVSFPSEIVRTTYHTIGYMMSDLASPNLKIKAMGAKRLAGLALVAALPQAVSMLTRWAANLDKEEEAALRRFLPEWNQNATLYYQENDGRGRIKMLDASYLDPWNYLKKPLSAALRGEGWQTSLRDAAVESLAPFAGEGLLTKVGLDLARNRDERGRPVWNPQAPFLDRASDAIGHAWQAFEPGAVTQAKRIVKGARGEVSASGRAYELEAEVAAVLTGARSQSVDVGQALLFRAKRFVGERQGVELIYRDAKDRQNGDPADVATARAKMEAGRHALYAALAEDVAAAQRLGLTRGETTMALLGAGLSQVDAALIAQGRYLPFIDRPAGRNRALQEAVLGR